MNTKLIEWVLRIGVAGEFLGHGVLAIQGKAQWIGWFAKFGIADPAQAATLLAVIGWIDVIVALVILFRPIPLFILYAIVWGFWTALLRPIVGEPIWDFVERAANWAAPLALFIMYGAPRSLREWFSFARLPR